MNPALFSLPFFVGVVVGIIVFRLGVRAGRFQGRVEAAARMHELNRPSVANEEKWSPRARDIANQILDEISGQP